MNALDYIRVVLIEPTHPGNIGATARAMGNMGASDLVLVNPVDFPSPSAEARAAAASHLLNAAKVVSNLDSAIADCGLVIGSTARTRSIRWPEQTPEQAADSIAAECSRMGGQSPIALLFGRESSGMTNTELERCNFLVCIPTAENFSSLNLASAVLVVLYEIRKKLGLMSMERPEISDQLASAEEMRHFYAHLQHFVEQIEFHDGRSAKLHRKMARLFNRVRMFTQEVKMLRGMFRAVEDRLSAKCSIDTPLQESSCGSDESQKPETMG